MKKVAVFGDAGGGKSALAQRLGELTGLPLYVVDMMQFRPGGTGEDTQSGCRGVKGRIANAGAYGHPIFAR